MYQTSLLNTTGWSVCSFLLDQALCPHTFVYLRSSFDYSHPQHTPTQDTCTQRHISSHSTLLSAIRTKAYWRTFHLLSSYVAAPTTGRRLIAHISSSMSSTSTINTTSHLAFLICFYSSSAKLYYIYIIYLLAITITYLLWLFITLSSPETRTHSQTAQPPSQALLYHFSLYQTLLHHFPVNLKIFIYLFSILFTFNLSLHIKLILSFK